MNAKEFAKALKRADQRNRSFEREVPAFGWMWPSAISQALGTKMLYYRRRNGIHGLGNAWPAESRAEVLVVVSDHPGKGAFSAFVSDLMRCYDEVFFWSVWNDVVGKSLLRREFRFCARMDGGETHRGMCWMKNMPEINTGDFVLMNSRDKFAARRRGHAFTAELSAAAVFKRDSDEWLAAARLMAGPGGEEYTLLEIGEFNGTIFFKPLP